VEKIKDLLILHKKAAIAAAVVILVILGIFLFSRKSTSNSSAPVEEVDLAFDAQGPYATLFPRRDGNALVLNLKRTSSYDAITYELAYTSKADEIAVKGNNVSDSGDGAAPGGAIDRGVQGTIDTKDKKGEYEQEILFGTCSKNVCKYDQGVENGTLTLHIRKGDKAYKMSTQWHIQKPDVALGVITSGDGHLTYKTDADRQALSNVGFTIVNDLTGVPKLPGDKQVSGKVYSLNVPIAKDFPAGTVSFETAETPSADAKLYRYNPSKSDWEALDSKTEGSTLKASATGAGIFAVLTAKK